MVTGGSGFLGSFVVERLADRGNHPVVLDVRRPIWTPDVTFMEGDVSEPGLVERAVAEVQPEAVVHLAGIVGTSETFDHPVATIRTNIIGTVNVLEALRRRPGSRFVGVQTGARWLSPYAITKWAAGDFAASYRRVFDVPVTLLRVFNAYGPRQDGVGPVEKIVPRFASNALRGDPLPIFGDGNQTIDLVHAEDCAELFVRAVEQAPGRGEVVDVGTGVARTVNDVATAVIEIVGRGTVRHLPPRAGEGPEYPVADTSTARELLGFVPDSALHGLRATIDWYAGIEGGTFAKRSRR